MDQVARFKILVMQSGAFDLLKEKLGGLLDKLNTMAASGELERLAKTIGEGLTTGISRAWAAATGLYDALEPFIKVFSAIVDVIGPANTAMGVMAVLIGGKLVMAIAALIPALASLGITIGATPIGWFIGIVAALVGLVYLIIKHWSKISGFFTGLWGSIKSATSTFIGWYVDSWAGVWDFFVGLWDGIVAKVQGALGFVNKAIDKLPNWLKKGIQVGINMATGSDSTYAANARAVLNGGGQQASKTQNQTRVKVDFANMPKGTRVSSDGDAVTDLSMGYAMATP
jgi:hypothetical protein